MVLKWENFRKRIVNAAHPVLINNSKIQASLIFEVSGIYHKIRAFFALFVF
jgi:hypothetical protein